MVITKTNYSTLNMDEFIGQTVHELNNFISSISGFTEIALMDAEANSDLKNYLDEVMKSVSNNDLFNQKLLLMIGRLPLNINIYNLKQLLQSTSFELSDVVEQEIQLRADLCWWEKVCEEIENFFEQFNVQPKTALVVVENSVSVIWVFDKQSAGKTIDSSRFFEPYYSSKVLSRGKGAGLCWIPNCLEKQNIVIDLNEASENALELKITFARTSCSTDHSV